MTNTRRLHRLTADFDLVTPAFCAGADTTKAELRLPSLLGVLRFWWRALAWSRTEGNDPEPRLRKIAGWEQDLFGSARTGQGSFVARLTDVQKAEDKPTSPGDRVAGYDKDKFKGPATTPWSRPPDGAVYLAGQGLTKRQKDGHQDQRASLEQGATFTLALTARKPFPTDSLENGPPSVIEAIRLLGLVGGIGSRSRRGFGSLRLTRLEATDAALDPPPTDPASYRAALTDIFKPLPADGMPIDDIPYTALTPHSRAWLVPAPSAQTDIAQLHNEMGFQFLYYRGTGYGNMERRKVGGVSKKIVNYCFEDDHQWFIRAREATSATALNTLPQRSIFGLPHNYYTPPDSAKLKVDIKPTDHERRGSPLFLHLHRFDQGPPVALWLFLPAEFLPGHKKGIAPTLNVVSHKNGVENDVAFTPDWAPIPNFIGSIDLPDVEPLWPETSSP